MSYYSGGETDSGYRDPGVRFVSDGPISPRSTEGKAAKKFLDLIGTLEFNAALFAYMVTQTGGAIEKRVMAIVKALIRSYAAQWDNGHTSETAMEAKRLADTLDTFGM